MALRPGEKPLPEHPARAERDLRLDDMVAGTQRIGFRIEEGIDALLLVVVEELPGDGYRTEHGCPERSELPYARARQPENRSPCEGDHRRSSQVWLAQHEPDRHRQHDERHHEVPEPARLLAVETMEVAGERENRRHFHQL